MGGQALERDGSPGSRNTRFVSHRSSGAQGAKREDTDHVREATICCNIRMNRTPRLSQSSPSRAHTNYQRIEALYNQDEAAIWRGGCLCTNSAGSNCKADEGPLEADSRALTYAMYIVPKAMDRTWLNEHTLASYNCDGVPTNATN